MLLSDVIPIVTRISRGAGFPSRGVTSGKVARNQTKALRRRIEEQLQQKSEPRRFDVAQTREMLHQCLDLWRAVSVERGRVMNASGQAIRILEHFEAVTEGGPSNVQKTNEASATAKTYSMCIHVIALYPEVETSCRDIMTIYHRCTDRDLQFYNVCLAALAKCSSFHSEAPILAEEVFQDVSNFGSINASDNVKVISANSETVSALLHAWANASGSRPDAAERCEAILQQLMKSHVHLVNTTCFNIVIDAWARQGLWKQAEAVLLQMFRLCQQRNDENLRPNVVSFNSAINACAKSKNDSDADAASEKAQQFFNQMVAMECNPTIETITSTMQAMLRTINPGPRVHSIVQNLEDQYVNGHLRVAPDTVCYLTAIQAWGRTATVESHGAALPAEKAEQLLRRMQTIASNDSSRANLDPCVVVYTALLDCWAKSGVAEGSDYVLRLFREMQQNSKQARHVTPNSVTLNVVVRALCTSGKMEEACQLLRNPGEGASVDLQACHTVLRAYANSGRPAAADKALAFLHDMESALGLTPVVQTYSLVLVTLGNSSVVDAASRAEDLFWNLYRSKDNEAFMTVRLMNGVLRAWAKCFEGGAAERAEQFLERAGRIVAPDGISHLHMIQVWGRSGRRNAQQKAQCHMEQIVSMASEDTNGEVVGRARTAMAKLGIQR